MPDQPLQRTSRELFLSTITGAASNLETWIIDRMTSIVDEEDVERGKRLFARGEAPEHIFFTLEGRVRLELEGRPSWILEGRSAIGVFDALLDRPHERTAVAETKLHLLKLRVEKWLELLEDSFGLARAAITNAVRTVAALEARRWALQTDARGHVVVVAPAFDGPLSFVERLAIFADDPLIRGAGIQVLVELADSLREITFEPGETIFERGHWRGESFFVLEGEAEGELANPQIRVLFGPGSFVGGIASLGEPILGWNVRARTRVRALSMRIEDWFDLMEEHFELVQSALAQFAHVRERILEDLERTDGELRVA